MSPAPAAAPPRLASRFTHVVVSDDGVGLVGPDDHVLVEPGAAARVFALVDGRLTAEEIARELDGELEPAVVHYTLMVLEDEGYLESAAARPKAPGGNVGDQPAADSGGGREKDPLLDALLDARRGSDPGEPAVLPRPRSVRAGGPPCDVVLADHYLEPRLAKHNARALEGDRPWLLARAAPGRLWLGPYVVPGETACWRCLAHRLEGNFRAQRMLHEAGPARARPAGPDVHRAPPPALLAALAGHLRAAADPGTLRGLRDRLLAFDPATGAGRVHFVSRRRRCPACGDRAPRLPRPVVVGSRPRVPGSAGGHRTVSPALTWKRLRHLVSPITGVVQRLNPVPVPGADLIHNYTAAHCVHLGVPTLRSLRRDRRDHSGGKGVTDMDARVGALCEAIERYSAVHQGEEAGEMASFRALGSAAVDPRDCLLFSDRQYAGREAWNADLSGTFQWVPEPFDPEAPIAWSPVWSLREGRFRKLPTAYLYYGFDGPGTEYCRADSNGLAAGNCLEEAILQGFLELVERDAVAIWWYNRTRQPGIDVPSFGDGYAAALMRYYESIDRHLWVLDLTADLPVPCFAALSTRTDGGPDEVIMGFGAHLDAGIALRRALTELNQGLPTVLRSPEERREQLLPEFGDAVRWWETASVEDHPYLLPDPNAAERRGGHFEAVTSSDLREDVERCVWIAAAHGLDVLVLDLTREDVDLAVAKVVVPGLRHFWRRLGPGRLYDVPVRLGRLPRPLSEDELNPVPLFL